MSPLQGFRKDASRSRQPMFLVQGQSRTRGKELRMKGLLPWFRVIRLESAHPDRITLTRPLTTFDALVSWIFLVC